MRTAADGREAGSKNYVESAEANFCVFSIKPPLFQPAAGPLGQIETEIHQAAIIPPRGPLQKLASRRN